MSVKVAAGLSAVTGALGIIVIAFSTSQILSEMTAIRAELRDEMRLFRVRKLRTLQGFQDREKGGEGRIGGYLKNLLTF